jgi:hypothetical protein
VTLRSSAQYRNTTWHWDHLTCLTAWKNKTLLTSGSATTKYIYSDLQYNYNFSKQIYTKTMYLLSRSTLKVISTKHIYTTKTIKFESITSNETKNRRASHLDHLLLTPFSSSPSLFFFRIITTFSVEFRCYIGMRTLAPWATTLGGCWRHGPRR